ncbi:MAG: hypothetical protein U9N53_12130 [Bacteroidota bacterium]|nr:hypothetical protein [Bacteroidota bacterium]
MIKFGVLTDEVPSKNNLPQNSHNNLYEISGICFVGRENTNAQTREAVNTPTRLSFDSLLNISDAILFLGETSLDQEKTTRALKRSRHIFLDHPPELTDHEYNNLVKLADEAGVLACIKNDLFNHPFIRHNSKEAGQTKHIEIERGFQETDRHNSQTLRMLFSDIQFISSIIGGNVIKSHVNGIRNTLNHISFFHIHLEFDNGSTASLNYKLNHNLKSHTAILYQADKQIILDFISNHTRILSPGQSIPQEIIGGGTGDLSPNNPGEPVIRQNSTDAILNFLDLLTVRSGKCINFEDSFMAFSLTKEIHLKLEQAKGVPVF